MQRKKSVLIVEDEYINAILLEIHPSKVENKKINDLINDLYVRGFVVDYILSKKHVLYITKFNR